MLLLLLQAFMEVGLIFIGLCSRLGSKESSLLDFGCAKLRLIRMQPSRDFYRNQSLTRLLKRAGWGGSLHWLPIAWGSCFVFPLAEGFI